MPCPIMVNYDGTTTRQWDLRVGGKNSCWKLLGDKVRDNVEIYADCPTVLELDNLKLMMKRRFDLGLKHYKIDLTPALLRNIEGTRENNLPTRKGLEEWGRHVKIARDIIGYDVKQSLFDLP